MFLTRMALDVNRPETAEILNDPEGIRRAVSSAFEYDSKRVLWRLDELSHRTWLVMLSTLRPDLWIAHQKYGYLGAFPSWETLDYDRELDDAYTDTVWRFELCASPSGTSDVVREEWQDVEYLNNWLNQQADVCGFIVRRVESVSSEWVRVGDKQMLLARWQGELRVKDEDLFLWAVTTGIGGGRDYGAGLMTISRVGNVWGI